MGARAAGMGYASSGLTDEWSLFNNPGSLGSLDQVSTAFAYETKARLRNANRMAVVLNAPLSWGVMALGAFRFGDDLYNEQVISTGAANKFGIASLGAKVNYIQYCAEGFGVSYGFSIDFGGLAQLTEQLSIGAYITNLTQAKIHSYTTSEELPTRLTAGVTFKPSSYILLSTELDKDIDYDPVWRTGFEYFYKKKFSMRTGFNIHPQAVYMGLGGKRKKLQFDYAVHFSELIGAAHQASASYFFVRKGKK